MAVFVAAAAGILSSRSAVAFTHPCISHFRHQSQFPPLFPPTSMQQSSLSQLMLCASSNENEDVVLYSDEWENGIPPKAKKNNRWNSLSPKVKAKIVKEAQAKAIRNKKNNESANDKKRRELCPAFDRVIGWSDSAHAGYAYAGVRRAIANSTCLQSTFLVHLNSCLSCRANVLHERFAA